MRLSYYTELGAYSTGGTHSIVDASTPSGAQGAYRVRNLEWTSYGVFTNKVPVGPYRGYGQHATAYLIERVMDLIAQKLTMDPAEVRRRNFIPADAFPYMNPMGREFDNGNYEAALDRALELVESGDVRLACHLVEVAVAAEPEHEGAQRARAEVYWHRRATERSLMSKGVFAAAARESEAALGNEVASDGMRSTIRDAMG